MVAAFVLVVGAEPVKLAAVGFSSVGMPADQVSFFSEHLAVKLAGEDGIRITTSKDIQALLGAERQRQLLGCADESTTCMAELAGALGVDGLVTGQVAKVGKSFQLSVKVLAGDGSRTLFAHASELLGSEEELLGELNRVAKKVSVKLHELLRPQAPLGVERAGGRPWGRLTPLALGVVAAGIGAGLLISAGVDYGRLSNADAWPGIPASSFLNQISSGQVKQLWGVLLAGVGGAAMLGGLIWYLAGGTGPQVSLSMDAAGASFVVTGAFP